MLAGFDSRRLPARSARFPIPGGESDIVLLKRRASQPTFLDQEVHVGFAALDRGLRVKRFSQHVAGHLEPQDVSLAKGAPLDKLTTRTRFRAVPDFEPSPSYCTSEQNTSLMVFVNKAGGHLKDKVSKPFRTIALFKPYDVLCQFSDGGGPSNLKNFVPIEGIYPAGRLDRDSEGLLLLTDDGRLAHRLTDPRFEHPKTYLVQVERVPHREALDTLRRGVT